MKRFILMFLATLSIITAVAVPLPALAQATPEESVCAGTGGSWDKATRTCSQPGNTHTVLGTLKQVTSLLIFLVGAIAVLMIIIGGFRYVVSQGDQAAITQAKNTIIYALIGLVVAVAAYAIVNLVFTALKIK